MHLMMFAFITIMESHNLSEKDAKLLLDEKDKRYHKRHLALTGSNRGDRHNRDILINSDFWEFREQQNIWKI